MTMMSTMAVDATPLEPDIRCAWVGCEQQATALAIGAWRPLCPRHVSWIKWSALVPLVRAPLGSRECAALAIGFASFACSFDATLSALAADPDGAQVALDYAQERGWGPLREWISVDKHGDPAGNNPHVWVPIKREDRHPAFSYPPVTETVEDHRCTCGMLKSKWDMLTHDEPLVPLRLGGLPWSDAWSDEPADD